MIPYAKIVCFNCKKNTLPVWITNSKGKRERLTPGVTLRKLEIRRPGKFGGKGKVVSVGWVCENCYKDGHTQIPLGGFNGQVIFKQPADHSKMLEFLKKQKEQVEKQGVKPVYPESPKPSSSTEP
mgnify:CR=1 FL=1